MAPLVRMPPASERLVDVSYSRSEKKFHAQVPTAAGAAAILQAGREGLTLAASSNTSGYKNVTFKPKERGSKKYKLTGKANVHLGYFATAEQAALFYARREAGRDTSDLTAPPPPPPPPAPSSAAGAEAVRQAEREGLTLATSSSTSGYKGVCYLPKERGSKKYQLQVTVEGKRARLGYFATAEQAALFYARREAGRDTSDLTAPPPPPPPTAPSSAHAHTTRHAVAASTAAGQLWSMANFV